MAPARRGPLELGAFGSICGSNELRIRRDRVRLLQRAALRTHPPSFFPPLLFLRFRASLKTVLLSQNVFFFCYRARTRRLKKKDSVAARESKGFLAILAPQKKKAEGLVGAWDSEEMSCHFMPLLLCWKSGDTGCRRHLRSFPLAVELRK